MGNERIYGMSFSKVYPLLIAKAEKKGRERAEVLTVTAWLTGYTPEGIESCLLTDTTYGVFFRNAPALNPKRERRPIPFCSLRSAFPWRTADSPARRALPRTSGRRGCCYP